MWYENEIEYIVEHLQNPEKLMDPEFVRWLKKEEHLILFEKIRNQREALLRLDKEQTLDVDNEYQRFKLKSNARRNIIRLNTWLAVAACVVVALVFGIIIKNYDTELVLNIASTDLTGRKCAELILANGERVLLENNSIRLQESNGICIENDTNLQLVYHQEMIPVETDTILMYNILKIPSGADYVVNLSDGTKVHLNCETEFRYPVRFAGNERRVYLKGEAFFEVAKSNAWPFIVETDQMHVKVMGTKFNVKAYQEEDIVHTTLVQGAVKVNTTEAWEKATDLVPSQQYCLNKKSGQAVVEKVDVQLLTDWIDGRFVFKNQRLEEVMNTLARWYSVEVFYATPSVKDWRLSAYLGRYEHIDAILKMIQVTNKVEIVRKDNVVTIGWK